MGDSEVSASSVESDENDCDPRDLLRRLKKLEEDRSCRRHRRRCRSKRERSRLRSRSRKRSRSRSRKHSSSCSQSVEDLEDDRTSIISRGRSISRDPFGVYGGVQNPSASGFNALQESGTIPPLGSQQTNSKSSSEPYIDAMTATNVTALVGKSAYLSCRVRNLGNKTVSWIRHRDIHILTVGSYTYTSDQRFQATHHRETDDWTLQIKWAQKRDAGIYECQISTQPVTSYFVHLNVVVPTAMILGGPDLHVDKGSTINLTCSIRFSPEPPAYIFWYHQDDVISYDSSRGGVSVITEKGDVTTSFLLIQHADILDSGKYSCSPSNADVASVRVHVLNGERPAAMQTGSAGLSNSSLNMVVLMIICYIYSTIYNNLQLNSSEKVFAQR